MSELGRIFLAHAQEDKPQVRQLYDRLKAWGFNPWLDAVDLLPGQLWDVEIPEAIRQAKIFLACFSEVSVKKSSYVQKEFRLALAKYAEMPPRSIWLIPVRLDDSIVPDHEIPELHLRIKDIQWVDLWREDGYERLFAAIKYVLDRQVDNEPTLRDDDAPWCPELVVIPPDRFLMGSPPEEVGRRNDEGPQHVVTIEYSLAVSRYPVTFAEWDAFTAAGGIDGRRPKDWGWGRGRRPVIDVTWYQAQTYVTWLSEQTKKPYRLLSEAEWEYACRAGTTTRYFYGDEITQGQANFGRKLGRTNEVGAYPPNAFRIYDMHGNVFEWVFDDWHDYITAHSDRQPNIVDNAPRRRVLRGGSWYDDPRSLRAAARYWRGPAEATNKIGFRVCRDV